MAPQQQAQPQPVTAITTLPADAHIGTQVFAVAGTDENTTPHLTRRWVYGKSYEKIESPRLRCVA
jgi:hypothetical protein